MRRLLLSRSRSLAGFVAGGADAATSLRSDPGRRSAVPRPRSSSLELPSGAASPQTDSTSSRTAARLPLSVLPAGSAGRHASASCSRSTRARACVGGACPRTRRSDRLRDRQARSRTSRSRSSLQQQGSRCGCRSRTTPRHSSACSKRPSGRLRKHTSTTRSRRRRSLLAQGSTSPPDRSSCSPTAPIRAAGSARAQAARRSARGARPHLRDRSPLAGVPARDPPVAGGGVTRRVRGGSLARPSSRRPIDALGHSSPGSTSSATARLRQRTSTCT